MKSLHSLPLVVAFGLVGLPRPVAAWDSPGHEIVNQVALHSLPVDYPAFVQEPQAVARVVFLAGEADRWSHSNDLSLKHYNWPDHYIDVEQLSAAGLDPATVTSFRYDFIAAFAKGRAEHPVPFALIDTRKDYANTRRWPGFLPWTATEYHYKVKAAFSSLKVYRELGTPSEIKNAEENVVYLMGMMGHYIGDLSEPLHTTEQHDGWFGPNPHGYFTGKGFHTWIDSGLIAKARITIADVESRVTPVEPISLAPRPDGRDPVFVVIMDFVIAQNKLVEPLYQLDLEGKLGRGETPVAPEARAFIENQLLKGGELLGSLWLTAWRSAPPDGYLRSVLIKRNLATTPAPAPSKSTP